MTRFWHDVPTAMISFGYPYYLYDAPRVPTCINACSTLDQAQEAVVELILGNASWTGTNPVDPFCGLQDARYEMARMRHNPLCAAISRVR